MPHSIIQIHHMIPRWVLACNGAGAIPHCRINDKRPKWWLEKRRVLCDVTCAFFCPSRKVQYFCYVQSEWLVATKIQSNTGQWPHMIRGNTVHILYFWPFSVLLPFFVGKKWPPAWPPRWFHQMNRDLAPEDGTVPPCAPDAAVFVVQSLLPFAGSAMSLHSQLFGRQEFLRSRRMDVVYTLSSRMDLDNNRANLDYFMLYIFIDWLFCFVVDLTCSGWFSMQQMGWGDGSLLTPCSGWRLNQPPPKWMWFSHGMEWLWTRLNQSLVPFSRLTWILDDIRTNQHLPSGKLT